MRLRGTVFAAALVAAFVVVGEPARVDAGPIITAYEILRDTPPYDVIRRDLERERSSTTQGTAVETDDGIIVGENSVDTDFGLVNRNVVSYSHTLSWLTPATSSYLTGQLTIWAWGNVGSNDQVFTDTINIGLLNNGTLLNGFSGLFSTTTFDVLAFISDGLLNVEVKKNVGASILASLNAFSVYQSRLDVSYEGPDINQELRRAPEPMTMTLLGVGMAGFAAVRRRRPAPVTV